MVLILLAAIAITSCSNWGSPYEKYDEEGKNISVKYLANGGIINSGAGSLMDVFEKTATGKISLIAPESAERGKSQVNLSHSSDYQFAGWYVGIPVTDAAGNALDEDGNLVSESNKSPAYTAGKRWDFSKDVITLDLTKEYTASEPVLTLIAMWVPKFDFEFYAKNAGGAWELINTKKAVLLELPKWSNGKINMMDFPAFPNAEKTFKSAYYDEAMANEISESYITGEIDYETGTAKDSVIKVYTEWYEGTWFMIENAAQLCANARANGNYMLLADIDMSKEIWPKVFSHGEFTGKIYGGGYAIKNINANQRGDYRRSTYGIFGSIGASAEFKDVTFENITYKVAGSLNNAVFGLLAGQVATGATFDNVAITGGKLIITDELISDAMLINLKLGAYDIGLIFGEGEASVTVTGVTCELENANPNVEITVAQNGTVTITVLDTPA